MKRAYVESQTASVGAVKINCTSQTDGGLEIKSSDGDGITRDHHIKSQLDINSVPDSVLINKIFPFSYRTISAFKSVIKKITGSCEKKSTKITFGIAKTPKHINR